MAEKNALRELRKRMAATRPRVIPTPDPMAVHVEIDLEAALSLSRSSALRSCWRCSLARLVSSLERRWRRIANDSAILGLVWGDWIEGGGLEVCREDVVGAEV